jgi:hypothetical protein
MLMIDPDKEVEKEKKEHPGTYQSTQHPEHFKDEGDEYLDLKEKEDNDIQENADYDKAYGLNTKTGAAKRQKENSENKPRTSETKDASDPQAASESGIPGTSETDNVGTPSAGAGLGANKGKGTSSFENQKNT